MVPFNLCTHCYFEILKFEHFEIFKFEGICHLQVLYIVQTWINLKIHFC